MVAEVIDAALDVPVDDDAPGRSRLLHATAERDRLERVLRMLPDALGGVPVQVPDLLVGCHRLVGG